MSDQQQSIESAKTEDSIALTQLLARASAGDAEAASQAIPVVYGKLLDLSRAILRSPDPAQTLSASDIAQEVYLRLFGASPKQWTDRAHFFRSAAKACRSVIVDDARARRALKREGPNGARIPEELVPAIDRLPPEERLALEEAMTGLASVDHNAHEVAQLRIYLGFSVVEVGQALTRSDRSVRRDWGFADSWLRDKLGN
ncbi:ECF-type sigma factor [Engelhardtia mirabilis]|uniref:RNA polymerase sigma factor SigD n=1 Tax=Engelhardtia mirabilis TaxID=2528011 RepID=A0A518BP46_9BACT|nr:RNA polymerase sigma factor SigD [Planctomycetes bacterium Pla133]QDV03076.1 RNA polymerase sigma factor SigD [Planctomycetes bacterium Pla86]